MLRREREGREGKLREHRLLEKSGFMVLLSAWLSSELASAMGSLSTLFSIRCPLIFSLEGFSFLLSILETLHEFHLYKHEDRGSLFGNRPPTDLVIQGIYKLQLV